MQETRSAGLLAAEARRLGFTVTTGVGGTGVVAVMANGPGPVLMLRADMDALPVEEQTGLAFASRVRGTTREGLDDRDHARLRPRHPHGRLGRHRAAAGGDAEPMVGHSGHDRPARRGDQPGRQGDARGRPVHPLPAGRPTPSPSTIRRRCRPGSSAIRTGPALANVDSVDMVGARRRRPRRLRRTRRATRSCSPAASSPRSRPWSAASSTRSTAPWSPSAASTPAPSTTSSPTRRGCCSPCAATRPSVRRHAARRHRPDRPRRGDRRRRARRPDADRHRPRSRGHPGDRQHRRADPEHRRPLPRPFRRGAGAPGTRRSMGGEDFGRFRLADPRHREPDLLGRRRAPGALGRRPAATSPACPRCTARSGPPTPNG